MSARIVIALIAIPVLIWAFSWTFGRELWSACKYAWWDAQGEVRSMKRAWRAKSLTPQIQDDEDERTGR